MGADPFVYVVPFQQDIEAALAALRHQEFLDVIAIPGWPQEWYRADAFDRFRELQYEADLIVGGVLELDGRVIGPSGEDEDGAIRLLTAAEIQAFFGTDHPTRADFDRIHAASLQSLHLNGAHETVGPCPPQCPHKMRPNQRDRGRCTVLYDHAGKPAQIALWGSSGD